MEGKGLQTAANRPFRCFGFTLASLLQLSLFETFVSVLSLPQVDLGNGFEIHVPQSDAAVSSSRSKSFFTGMHAEDPCLNNVTGKKSVLLRVPCRADRWVINEQLPGAIHRDIT